MKKQISIYLLIFLLMLGCTNKKYLYNPGPSKKTYTPQKTYTPAKTYNKNSYCSLYLSPTSAVVGRYYSAKIGYTSNYVSSPQYYAKDLPTGLTYNSLTGYITGYPKQTGTWKITIGVRDRYKGTHRQPRGQVWYYQKNNLPMTITSTYTTKNTFPTPQTVGRVSSSSAVWEIKNDTAYTLSISYSGPYRSTIAVSSRGSKTLYLNGGSYSVSGYLVGAPSIKPYSGSIAIKKGWKYRSNFYIRGGSKTYSPPPPKKYTPAPKHTPPSKTSKSYCRVYFTPPAGTRGKYYYTTIRYTSNTINKPYYYSRFLPPGLKLNPNTGSISGYPSQKGTWKVEVGVRDYYKGTHFHPNTKDWWYLKTGVPLTIHDTTSAPAPKPGAFPKPVQVGRYSSSSHSLWEIKNQTAYTLYINYKGISGGAVTLSPHSTKSLTLQGGSYSVQGTSAKPGVLPYLGTIYLKSGMKYRNIFYIRTTYRK